MNFQKLFVAVPVTLLVLGNGTVKAGQTIEEAFALACVTDKWDVKEPEKGHKLVDYAGRCIDVPDNQGEAIYTEDCVGKYEYMPDESWKGSGSCTRTFKGGDHVTDSWEEGSHLKGVNTYKTTGGTGKYQGATGGGTYTFDNLTDTLGGGRLKGKIILP
jgi:hypothetical protein